MLLTCMGVRHVSKYDDIDQGARAYTHLYRHMYICIDVLSDMCADMSAGLSIEMSCSPLLQGGASHQ